MDAGENWFDPGVDLLDAAGPIGDDTKPGSGQRGHDRAGAAVFEFRAQAAEFLFDGEKIILAQFSVMGGHGFGFGHGAPEGGQFSETIFPVIGVFGYASQQVVKQITTPDGVIREQGQPVAAGKTGENPFAVSPGLEICQWLAAAFLEMVKAEFGQTL